MVQKTRLDPIVAGDTNTARSLILKGVRLGAKRVIVPEVNIKAVKLMEELNAKPLVHCIRMRLGPTCNEDTSRIYGIPNYAKG